jgi:hypothetical protein
VPGTIPLVPAPRSQPPASESAIRGPVRDEGPAVIVSIPLVAIAGLAVFVLYRYMGLRVWQAVLCLLLGFLLAATTAGPHISSTLTAIVHWLDGPRS